jgi:nickel-dependent lactate racemase
MPFVVQVLEGHGDTISHVLGGSAQAVATEGHRLLDRHWRVAVDRSADLVVAAISGDPKLQSFAEVTRALACAGRVVKPGGQIAVLSRAQATLGPSVGYLRQADTPAAGLAQARQHHASDAVSAWQLAKAAEHAKLYLLSDIPAETVEELFATPLENAGQVQRLIDAAESCLLLPDAHRTLAVVQNDSLSQGASHGRTKSAAPGH